PRHARKPGPVNRRDRQWSPVYYMKIASCVTRRSSPAHGTAFPRRRGRGKSEEKRAMIPHDAERGGVPADSADGGGAAGQTTPLSLLQRVRGNDPEAWGRLVQLYRPLLLFWC